MASRRVPLLLLLLLSVAHAREGEQPLPAPGREPWRPMLLRGVERPTRYEAREMDGRSALLARSECGASAWVLPLDDVELARTPRLRWEWRIEREPEPSDVRVREGDDFAARVYVMFRFEPEASTLWQRWRRRLAGALYDQELPGSALSYVWSRSEPAGATWKNPFAEESRMLSLGAGPLGQWKSENVDLRADYRRIFGREPPPLVALGLMSDADQTCSRAEALFANFVFW